MKNLETPGKTGGGRGWKVCNMVGWRFYESYVVILRVAGIAAFHRFYFFQLLFRLSLRKQMKLWNMTLKDLKPWCKKGDNI